MKYKAAIFDMDGTVLNTLDDLMLSINYALDKTGHRHDYGLEEVRQFFGSGIRVAAKRALSLEKGAPVSSLEMVGTPLEVLPEGVTDAEVDRIQDIFVPYYVDHCNIATRPYDGIMELLAVLKAKGIHTAVVSNKSDPAVQELSQRCFQGMFERSMGEQEGVIKRKPAPDMTLKVMEELGLSREETVYIGDSEIDLLTARNTGIDCIAVTWGFRSREFLENHGAGTIADNAGELLALILG